MAMNPSPQPSRGLFGMLMDVVDTPGALTRGFLAGRPGERVSGQELLGSWGVDLGERGNGIAGFLADMAVDPLNLVSGGAVGMAKLAGKAGKVGKASKAIGAVDDAVVASSKAGFLTDAVKKANKSCRPQPNAVVPRLIPEVASKTDRILDFGAGREAMHARKLRDAGYDVTAYDFGDNLREWHDANALSREYDKVYASNVINVQDSDDMLNMTLNQIKNSTLPDGEVILNLPSEPRYGAWSGKNKADWPKLMEALRSRFHEVNRKGDIFHAKRPIY